MPIIIIYFFIVALYNPIILGMNFSNYIIIFSLFFLLIFKNIRVAIYNKKDNNIIFLLLFYTYFCINLIFSNNKQISLVIYFKLFMPIIFYILLLNTVTSYKKLEKFINILVYSTFFASIYGCMQYFFDLSNYSLKSIDGIIIYRAIGSFSTANIFGSYLTLVIPFLIYKVSVSKNKKLKFTNIIVLLTVLFCLYLTYSRWSLISLFIVGALYMFKTIIIKMKNRSLNIFKMINFLFFACVFLYIANKYIDVYNLFISRGSNEIRMNNLLLAIDRFKDNFYGYGLGNGNNDFILDSTYIQLLVDGGILGVTIFIMLLISLYVKIKKRSIHLTSDIFNITKFSLVIFIVNCLLETVLYNSLINIFLGIYLFIENINFKEYNAKNNQAFIQDNF